MSPHRVVLSRRADEDVAQAIDYYLAVVGADAALRFVDALETAQSLLVTHPSIGSARFAVETGIDELRELTLSRHPYTLVYTDDPDAVRIHRVLHTSRDIPAALTAGR